MDHRLWIEPATVRIPGDAHPTELPGQATYIGALIKIANRRAHGPNLNMRM